MLSDGFIKQARKSKSKDTTLRTASASWDYTMMKGTIADIGKAKGAIRNE